MSGMSEESELRNDAPGPASVGKLSLGALAALVIGSMIGSGIFGLPSQIARSAAPGPMLIGWAITGFGMLMLAFSFQILARRKPHVEDGVYGYAHTGFGNYIGYTSAWGYWLSAWIGNIGYFVLLFASLGTFWPVFRDGTTLAATIGASVLLWVIHALVLHGVRDAAIVNTIVTVAKIVPLLTFIVLVALSFKAGVFTNDFWGQVTKIDGATLGDTATQVKSMMLITVWVFIGIEGASIYSHQAKKSSDVGRATMIGFLGVLSLLVLVNVLSYGVMQRPDIAKLEDPSTAGVLRAVVGDWGTTLISIGIVVSLLGALLSWVMLCAEILRGPAIDHTLPAFLGHENAKGAPSGALWLTSLCMQAMLVWNYVSQGSYEYLLLLATSLILLPYFWSALYQVLVSVRGEGYERGSSDRTKDIVTGVLAVVYAIWLLYAAGPSYLVIGMIAYLVGTALFVYARMKAKERVFSGIEVVYFLIVFGLAIWGMIGLANGTFSLS